MFLCLYLDKCNRASFTVLMLSTAAECLQGLTRRHLYFRPFDLPQQGKSKGGSNAVSNGSVPFKRPSESEIPNTVQHKLILYSCIVVIIVKTIK